VLVSLSKNFVSPTHHTRVIALLATPIPRRLTRRTIHQFDDGDWRFCVHRYRYQFRNAIHSYHHQLIESGSFKQLLPFSMKYTRARARALLFIGIIICQGLPSISSFVHSPIPTSTRSTFLSPLFKAAAHQQQPEFDEVAYEIDRLEKDAQAMDAMKEVAENEFAKLRTPWKWDIRKRIWDMMEEKDIARFPRPVHHRIPNFVGAELAAARLADLAEFQQARWIKVNPDTPQRAVRHAVLAQGKTLLTPQPRLRTGFFSTIQMNTLPSLVKIDECTNSKGVTKWGTPVTLNDKYTVDLVVVGSTAVCPETGARVGKGEGFAELEWGILSAQGNLDPATTLVVTTVHDEQIVNDIPAGALTKHDVPVDIIVTPTKVIRVPNRAPKPSGVFWDLLSPQKLAQIRVLRQLKQEIEESQGKPLPSGPDEVLPPVAKKSGKPNKNKESVQQRKRSPRSVDSKKDDSRDA
jgi:5-formyltetrahydrofolate cyclo-ligase